MGSGYGEGTPLEDAYKDPWLYHLYDSDSNGDGMSVDSISSRAKDYKTLEAVLRAVWKRYHGSKRR